MYIYIYIYIRAHKEQYHDKVTQSKTNWQCPPQQSLSSSQIQLVFLIFKTLPLHSHFSLSNAIASNNRKEMKFKKKKFYWPCRRECLWLLFLSFFFHFFFTAIYSFWTPAFLGTRSENSFLEHSMNPFLFPFKEGNDFQRIF